MSDDEKSAAGEKDAPLRSARQWVVVRGTSMDLRVGTGILSEFPRVLRSAAGRPHACALVHEGGVSDDVVRVLHDNLCDQGFRVSTLSLGAVGCDLAEVERLNVMLRDARITSDDIVLAVGGLKTLSVASFVCSSWLGGTQLAEVPTDLASAVVAATTPRALDSAGLERVVSQDATARYTMIDLDLVGTDPKSETALLAFALMVQTAMCDSDRAFGKLWDAADDLAAGDEAALTTQLQDTLKSRGKVSSATSAALRQSLEFGTTFADALLSLAPGEVSRATALADGMRFAARLGVAQETLSVDDMLAVDEVLERLGVPTARVTVDAGELAARIRDARFQRTNRFMLAVPRALGRVRLAVMTDDLLAEHTAAWCASRP
ncbi:3-dehydroquinate synthase [Thermophilibacter sp.]|uniref:3-dehydroquinate synthase family protein n=1 Tax=Thermophilibacter sp. TaxID=2847309 RepID=UPI003A8E28DB